MDSLYEIRGYKAPIRSSLSGLIISISVQTFIELSPSCLVLSVTYPGGDDQRAKLCLVLPGDWSVYLLDYCRYHIFLAAPKPHSHADWCQILLRGPIGCYSRRYQHLVVSMTIFKAYDVRKVDEQKIVSLSWRRVALRAGTR